MLKCWRLARVGVLAEIGHSLSRSANKMASSRVTLSNTKSIRTTLPDLSRSIRVWEYVQLW